MSDALCDLETEVNKIIVANVSVELMIITPTCYPADRQYCLCNDLFEHYDARMRSLRGSVSPIEPLVNHRSSMNRIRRCDATYSDGTATMQRDDSKIIVPAVLCQGHRLASVAAFEFVERE